MTIKLSYLNSTMLSFKGCKKSLPLPSFLDMAVSEVEIRGSSTKKCSKECISEINSCRNPYLKDPSGNTDAQATIGKTGKTSVLPRSKIFSFKSPSITLVLPD